MGNLDGVSQKSLVECIHQWRENKDKQENRPHLGFSQIGDKCDRKLWYIFHHVAKPSFKGRILRLFDTGHRAEARFVEELRAIGFEVWELDPNTCRQLSVRELGGHLSGSLDAVIKARPNTEAFEIAGGKPIVCEMKTHNEKSFAALAGKLEKGVRVFDPSTCGVEKTKPVHFAQANIYAYKMGIDKCLYMAVNKNTDELYIERWKTKKRLSKSLIKRGVEIVNMDNPPAGISNNSSWYECRFCDFSGICHDNKIPEVNCRTCLHSTPNTETGKWDCARHGESMRADGTAMPICAGADHRFIPSLLPWDAIDANQDDNWIQYVLPNGQHIRNGSHGDRSFSSTDIKNGSVDAFIASDIGVADLGIKDEGKMPWQ